jgi:hypothetical protein
MGITSWLRKQVDVATGAKSRDGRWRVSTGILTAVKCATCGKQFYRNRYGLLFTEHGALHQHEVARGRWAAH